MRRSSTSWARPRAEGKRAALSGVLALVALLALGCVTRGKHGEVVAERDALRERVRLLEASNESLSNERVKLISEVEDLGSERESLAKSVEELRAARDRLQDDLASTSTQLAARTSEVQELRSTYDGLVADLQTEVAAGRIQIEQLRDGLNVKLAQGVLFAPGSAEVGAEGADVLGKVAHRLAEVPHRVLVEGHTDNVPIQGRLAARYPSNWELAGARAAAVVRILAAEGIPAARLTAVSLADTRPVAPNETSEGQAQNRRIEIRLLPITDATVPAAIANE